MSRLTILAGISGAGKTTYTRKRIEETGEVSVCKDRLREVLYAYDEETIRHYYKLPDFEEKDQLVDKIFFTMIQKLLDQGFSVIADVTNMKGVKEIDKYRAYNVPTDLILFDTPLSLAKDRLSKRHRSCSEELSNEQAIQFVQLQQGINSLWNNDLHSFQVNPDTGERKFFYQDIFPVYKIVTDRPDVPKAIIVDIDDTISKICDRDKYDATNIHRDNVIKPIADLVDNYFHAGFVVLFCTARDERFKKETELWLEANNIQHHGVYYRKNKDDRADWIVKEEMFREISADHNIQLVIDDKESITSRAKALGINSARV